MECNTLLSCQRSIRMPAMLGSGSKYPWTQKSSKGQPPGKVVHKTKSCWMQIEKQLVSYRIDSSIGNSWDQFLFWRLLYTAFLEQW